jgi:diacylglycerol kinase family enzyme
MYLLVGNPSAQSGRNADRIDEARRVMDRLGMRHDFLATRPGGLTVQDVSRALRGGAYQVVISMGGDGTFHEVAKGLLASGSDVPMGMLPTGTANDQGRSFGLSSSRDELERNVATIAAGHLAPCDAGRVTAFDLMDQPLGTNWFFDSIGWGISARTLRMRNEDRQLVAGVPILREVYRDQLVYAGALLRSFLASYIDEQKFEVEVETDDGRTLFLDGLTDLVIKNTRIYAGAWVLDPTSLPDDGEMELVPFRGRQEWIARAIATLDGLPVKPPVESVKELSPVVRARRFELRIHDRPMGEPVEAQLDGEEWVTAARWQVETVRHAIRLVVPENPAPSRFFGLFG